MKQKISITINDKILRDVDSIVDNIYIRNRSQAFEYLIKRAFKERKIAVILAGESKNNPANELKHRYSLKVNHSTIVEKTIRKLSDSGFKKIYIVSDHLTLTNIFKIIGDGSDFKTHIEFIDEEIQEGSSSALKLLKGKIKTTFLVIQCDLIIDYIDLLELWQNHLKENVAVTMLVCSSITPTKKAVYGHVNLQGNKVLIYQEKPTKEKLKSSIFFGGVFVAEPEVFSYPGKSLEHDIFPELARRRLLGGLMSSTEHLHIHTSEDLARIRRILKNSN